MRATEQAASDTPTMTDDLTGVDLSLIRDDPGFRVQRRLGLIPREGMGAARRAMIFAAFSWLPLVVWAILTGRVWGSDSGNGLWAHFGVHVRCLVAIPAFVVAEDIAEKTMPAFLRYFVVSGLVPADKLPQFRALIDSMTRLRKRVLPWVLMLGVVIAWTTAGTVFNRVDDMNWQESAGRGASGAADAITFGGWWFVLVIRPLFMMFLIAWLWRTLLVFVLCFKLSKFPLAFVPVHPDRVGGLGFVERLAFVFSPVAFAISMVIAAGYAHDVLYHGLNIVEIKGELIAIVVLLVVIFLVPFTPLALPLGRVKRDAVFSYGSLVGHHGRFVHRRWILKEEIGSPVLLDAPELGPVADIQTVYQAVKSMRSMVVGKLGMFAIVVPAAVPVLLIACLQFPVHSVLTKVLTKLI